MGERLNSLQSNLKHVYYKINPIKYAYKRSLDLFAYMYL